MDECVTKEGNPDGEDYKVGHSMIFSNQERQKQASFISYIIEASMVTLH